MKVFCYHGNKSTILFFIQFLEQLLKFLVNFTLLKYVKSQRSYGFLITKELIFGFQIFDVKDHFSASLKQHELSDTLSKEFMFKCLSVMSYEQFIDSMVEPIMLSWQQILIYNFHNMSHLAFLSLLQVTSSYVT